MAFILPPQWEITGYDYDKLEGRFSFASPTQPMLQFSYRRIKGEPDMMRTWEERYRKHLGSDDVSMTFKTLQNQILLATTNENQPFYASRYFPENQMLLEWIFARQTKNILSSVTAMLENFHDNPPADGYQRYALFGLDALIPSGYELTKIAPYPADVKLVFENARHHTLSLHRLGLAAWHLKNEPLENFYHRCLYNQKFAIKQTATLQDGSVSASFRLRGHFGLDMLLGSWWRGEGTAFVNRDDNRIYAMEHIAPNGLRQRECVQKILKTHWEAAHRG